MTQTVSTSDMATHPYLKIEKSKANTKNYIGNNKNGIQWIRTITASSLLILSPFVKFNYISIKSNNPVHAFTYSISSVH